MARHLLSTIFLFFFLIKKKFKPEGLAKISAAIKNAGTSELTNVNWSISVICGLLGATDVHSIGTITTLAAGDEVSVINNEIIFRLGKIVITATADQTIKTAEGFVFGPFIPIK